MRTLGWVIVALLVLILVAAIGIPLLLLPAASHMVPYGFRGMMGPRMMGGYVGVVVILLLVTLLVAGVVWLVRSAGRGMGPMSPAVETPLDILKRRYASGEITKEQFDDMKRDLGL